MNSRMATVALTAVLMAGLMNLMSNEQTSAEPKEGAKKVLRHVVLFKFKAETSKEQIQQIVDAFKGLPSKIDSIRDFEWGTDVSPEGKSKGFTHCFFVTFSDEKGRDAYLPHAAHQDFVKIIRAHVEDVCVVDYWTGK